MAVRMAMWLWEWPVAEWMSVCGCGDGRVALGVAVGMAVWQRKC